MIKTVIKKPYLRIFTLTTQCSIYFYIKIIYNSLKEGIHHMAKRKGSRDILLRVKKYKGLTQQFESATDKIQLIWKTVKWFKKITNTVENSNEKNPKSPYKNIVNVYL